MVTHALEKGYKQTELSLIPEDWEIKKIQEFADVTAGGTPSTFVSEYWNGNIKWMNSGELNLKKIFDVEGRITESGLKNSSTRLLPSKCVLIGLAGQGKTRGTVAMNYVELCTNQSIGAILPNDSFVPEYMYHNLDSRYNELRKLSTGEGGRGGLNLTIIRNIAVSLPTKEEQFAIAHVLSDTDGLIEALDRLIEKKKNIKQGAMQVLLTGKKRLPGFSGVWDEKMLPRVCWFQEGPGIRNWQFTKDGMKVINVTNLENGYLNLKNTDRHISLEEFDRSYHHFEIDEGDIVVASSGNSYAKVAVVRKQDLPLMMNTSVIRFKPLKELVHEFLLEFLKSKYFKDQIDLLITGGAQPNFGPAHLSKIKISVPPTREEQLAIAKALFDMDLEVEELEHRRDKYRQLKTGMMQQLLTGRIRVNWQS